MIKVGLIFLSHFIGVLLVFAGLTDPTKGIINDQSLMPLGLVLGGMGLTAFVTYKVVSWAHDAKDNANSIERLEKRLDRVEERERKRDRITSG